MYIRTFQLCSCPAYTWLPNFPRNQEGELADIEKYKTAVAEGRKESRLVIQLKDDEGNALESEDEINAHQKALEAKVGISLSRCMNGDWLDLSKL
jgi:hypothetical protein